jgi:hypothetical protein
MSYRNVSIYLRGPLEGSSRVDQIYSKASNLEPQTSTSPLLWNSSTPVVTTATDFEDSQRCQNSWKSWESSLSRIQEPPLTSNILVTKSVWETWIPVGDGTPYITCDNIPRWRWSSTPRSSTSEIVTQIVTQTSWDFDYNYAATKNWTKTLKNWAGKDWALTDEGVFSTLHAILNRTKPYCEANSEFCGLKFDECVVESPSSPCDLTWACGRHNPFEYTRDTGCFLFSNYEIMLYYWPPILSSRDICGPNGNVEAMTIPPNITHGYTHVTTALTFAGDDIYIKAISQSGSWINLLNPFISPSVLPGPFTFTYPSVYIAHHPITRDDYRKVGENTTQSDSILYPAGIFELAPTDIYSRAWNRQTLNPERGLKYAKLVAAGEFHPSIGPMEWNSLQPQSFNFADLENPVPASQYYNNRRDCWGNQTHCRTITDDSYRPRIYVRNKVWKSIFSGHLSCGSNVILHDPPRAIPISAVHTLDIPVISTRPVAQPGNGIGPALSMPTPTAAVPQYPKFGDFSDNGKQSGANGVPRYNGPLPHDDGRNGLSLWLPFLKSSNPYGKQPLSGWVNGDSSPNNDHHDPSQENTVWRFSWPLLPLGLRVPGPESSMNGKPGTSTSSGDTGSQTNRGSHPGVVYQGAAMSSVYESRRKVKEWLALVCIIWPAIMQLHSLIL